MIPRILLGTSPFIGAGQFGYRALMYYEAFYHNPTNILKIFRKAYELGVDAVQLIPYQPVVKAAQSALENGINLTIVGSVRPKHAERDIIILEKLDAAALIAHGEITDSCSLEELSHVLKKMRGMGKPVGVATHKPKETLRRLIKTDLDCEIIMLPLNALGVFMDGEPREIIEMLEGQERHVIAMKTLAAGIIPPNQALKYIAEHKCIRSVALGLATEHEVEETLTVARELLSDL